MKRPFDDIVYVGGDTQGVLNFEYRIPIVGHIVTMAPFFDVGNAWVTKKNQLQRQVFDSEGNVHDGRREIPAGNELRPPNEHRCRDSGDDAGDQCAVPLDLCC